MIRRVASILVVGLMAAVLHAGNVQETLAAADDDLKAGRFRDADRRLKKLSRAISEHFGSGPQAMYTVAVIASFRAIDAVGMGNRADAEWYWNVATSLYPKFRGSNLRVYGQPGEAIMRIDASNTCEVRDIPAGHIAPPKPIETPLPKYPYHAVETGIAERITVQIIVTENGATRCPRVVETHDDPSLAWVLLEAMKNWRYEPARLDGAAVAVPFEQTLDFRIKYW